MPGGVAANKARNRRRRPTKWQRRHEARIAEDDEAAASASPYSTLRLSTAAWAAMGATSWVLRTIVFGLRIPWTAPPAPTRSKGYAKPDDENARCVNEVKRWVGAGFVRRLSKATGASSLWVSPTFIVHGPKDRLVVDLRRINLFIAERKFKYQRRAHFLSTLLPDEHLVSWDVKDAFYHVRLWPAHRKYFRFIVDGVVYEPRVRPFGMRLSPWAWTKVFRLVVAALRSKGYTAMAYVDDFAATGCGTRPSTASSATAGRVAILDLFKTLGLHVHPTKGVANGTTELPLLGFLVDTRRQLLLLPKTRLDKLVTLAKTLLTSAGANARTVSAKALCRFTGTAVSCSLAIPSARFYLRRLYNCQGKRTGSTKLCHGATRDLLWFAHLKDNPGVGRALWADTVGHLTTDASPWGWGGHWGNTVPAAGFFTLAQRNWHINVKEVCAVRFSLLAFGKQMAGRTGTLRLRVDNQVAMHVINSLSSRSTALMTELRRLHTVVQRLGITITATWIASAANVWADALSRQRDRDNWRLDDATFQRLQDRYGIHTVDRFATALNTRCARFNSLRTSPGTEGVDTFSLPWGGNENSWIYPPFSQVARVIDKVVADKATATVILPVWTAQEWWGPAVAHATEAWLLPGRVTPFSSGRARLPATSPRWRIAVFRFVIGGHFPAVVQATRAAAERAFQRRQRFNRRQRRTGGGVANARRWRVPPPEAALTELPRATCGRGPSSQLRLTDMTATGAVSPPTARAEASGLCRPARRPSSSMLAPCGGAARS